MAGLMRLLVRPLGMSMGSVVRMRVDRPVTVAVKLAAELPVGQRSSL
jgi:hypothetical protein